MLEDTRKRLAANYKATRKNYIDGLKDMPEERKVSLDMLLGIADELRVEIALNPKRKILHDLDYEQDEIYDDAAR